MSLDRLAQEQRERELLAPCAQRSAESRGRDHPEPAHPLRTEYQRDRDRIVHSRAFRRLEYKTQVFLNGTGDHYRTRLTHSIEVAAIARTIARALRLNEDLAEAVSLAHDLGHSPFGHSGERTLNLLMKGYGGFEHNLQSLRVVELLERKYARFDGLNLTWEVREGLGKHLTAWDRPKRKEQRENPGAGKFRQPSLEAQIANIADEITYYSHDLDDGLEAGLLRERDLARLRIWRAAQTAVCREHRRIKGNLAERKQYLLIRSIISHLVEDVILTSEQNIAASGAQSADDARRLPRPLIAYSAACAQQTRELRQYLYRNFYFNPIVHTPNLRACALMRKLFHAYLQNPQLMGGYAQSRIARDGLHRAVCDYVAGMTDRYALGEWERLARKI